VGGNVKLCVPGKGLATVGVGPESAEGIIKAGRKESKTWRWGWNSWGWEVVRGVRVMRNLGKCAWGRDGSVSSIGYMRDKDCAIWCWSEEVR
jgi:hypothetical protein